MLIIFNFMPVVLLVIKSVFFCSFLVIWICKSRLTNCRSTNWIMCLHGNRLSMCTDHNAILNGSKPPWHQPQVNMVHNRHQSMIQMQMDHFLLLKPDQPSELGREISFHSSGSSCLVIFVVSARLVTSKFGSDWQDLKYIHSETETNSKAQSLTSAIGLSESGG